MDGLNGSGRRFVANKIHEVSNLIIALAVCFREEHRNETENHSHPILIQQIHSRELNWE